MAMHCLQHSSKNSWPLNELQVVFARRVSASSNLAFTPASSKTMPCFCNAAWTHDTFQFSLRKLKETKTSSADWRSSDQYNSKSLQIGELAS